MTAEKKRAPGRPAGKQFTIQKHVFLDKETAAKLARLAKAAGEPESQYIRKLIQAQ